MPRIDEISSVTEAICHVQDLTRQKVTEDEFFRIVVAHALPIYATAPIDAKFVKKIRGSDGRLVMHPAPDIRASFITLLQPEIEQIRLGGIAITDRPAWLIGSAQYVQWEDVLAFRQLNHRVVAAWEVDDGEWMGQSDTYFFAQHVKVTPQSNLCVPKHTVAEVVRIVARSASCSLVAPLPEQLSSTELERDCFDVESSPQPVVVRGIDKSQVLIAFENLLPINLKLALGDPEHIFGDGVGGARVQRGVRGGRHKSLWNPVILAVGVYEKYRVPRLHLNRMFNEHSFLALWREEWEEIAESLP